MRTTPAVLVAGLAVLAVLGTAYGHGTGSETLPPVEMNGMMVTIQVSSETDDAGIQVDLSMIQDDTKDPIDDVVYLVAARHGQTQLFTEEFHRDDGRMVFEFVSEGGADEITVRDISEGGLFGIFAEKRIEVAGPGLADGGLYSFDVTVLSASGYQPPEPPVFNSAISIPKQYDQTVRDDYWGDQEITFITYYDQFQERSYDAATGEVSFTMPFEWTPGIIEQIETVHVEFSVPDTFGGLLVADFAASVNGIELDQNRIEVDDYFSDYRTIHVVIPRGDLVRMYDELGGGDTMEFAVRPASGSPYSSVTSNGQYRVLVYLEPPGLPAGGEADVSFSITDVFLRRLAVETSYQMAVTHNGALLHSQGGVSSKDGPITATLSVPDGISGPGEILFYNIDGNDLATASIPVVFFEDTAGPGVPGWVRTTAGWWAEGLIDDGSFIEAIKYLIENGVIDVQPVQAGGGAAGGHLEEWVRTTVGWWAEGLVSDAEFLAGIKHLMESGVISVNFE